MGRELDIAAINFSLAILSVIRSNEPLFRRNKDGTAPRHAYVVKVKTGSLFPVSGWHKGWLKHVLPRSGTSQSGMEGNEMN